MGKTKKIDGTSLQEIYNGFISAFDDLSQKRKDSMTMEEFEKIQAVEYELGLIRDNLRRKLEERKFVNETAKDLSLLLEFPIIPETRNILKKIIPNIILPLEEMRNEIIGRTSNSIEDFNCHNGTEFLQSILQSSTFSKILTLATIGELQTLQKEVGSVIGKEHRPIVLLLFCCLKGNLAELKNILKIHLGEYQSSCFLEDKDCPNFFRHARYFLEVYADISHVLIKHIPIRGEKQRSIDLRTKSRETLERIFTDKRLQIAKEPISDKTIPNLFTLLKENIPWFCGELEETPFDGEKIQDLITFEISRERVIQSLIELNDFTYLSTLRQLDSYIKQRKQISNNSCMPTEIDSQIEKLMEKANLKFIKNGSSWEEKLIKIKEYLEENKEYLYPSDHAKTTSVLIRLIKPEFVFKNPVAQKQITDIYLTLKNAPELKNNVVFAKSLEKLLNKESPYLDLPLEEINHKSLRDLLVELVINNFDENFIKTGSDFNSTKENKNDFRKEPKSMLRLKDAENLEKTKTPIGKNFDTAGIGIQREWIIQTAKKYYEEIGHNYSKALLFSLDMLRDYFKSNQNYEFMFGSSGMDVFRKFLICLPKFLKKAGNAVMSEYEYTPIRTIFQKNLGKVNFIQPNCIGQQKTVDQYVEEVIKLVDKKTKIIWLSMDTRFGDAPYSGEKRNNFDCLTQVIEKLKLKLQIKERGSNKYKKFIPIGIDGVQSLGRRQTEGILEKCRPDIYLIGAQKALGIKGVGIIAVSKTFQEFLEYHNCDLLTSVPQLEKQEKLKDGTLPIENIIATSIALKKQQESIDMLRPEGNLSEEKEKSLEKEIANQMQNLTDYAIQKFEQNKNFTVLFPLHRNKQDYNGIITFQVKNYDGHTLKEKIDQSGYILNHVREISPNTFRISFHYLHNQVDIDALLQSITTILESKDDNDLDNFD